MKRKQAMGNAYAVCAVDTLLIVAIAEIVHQSSLWNRASLRIEWLLIGVSALLAAFLLRLAGIGLDGRPRPATRYALRTLALWIVVQGFVLLKMIALAAVTTTLLVWFFDWTIGVALALALFRIGLSIAHRRSLRVPGSPSRVAIVGGGEWVERLAESIDTAGAARYRFVGAYRATGRPVALGRGAFVATDLASFAASARTAGADEIWIALPLDDDAAITRVIDEFRHDFVELRLMPDVSKHALFGSRVEDILGAPAISLAAPPLSRGALFAKAVFDRAFAAVVLIVLMPLLLVVAVAIKLTSPGPVLFTQRRRGADGQTFDIYKFRTMRTHVEQPGTVAQATRNDPRVTKVGAFLRRTSLDELPQFINVLFGDMSVVGPRPHAVEHDAHYRTLVDGYIHRYRIKPGITGWAQVNGLRGATERLESMQSRVEYDLYYLRNWSFTLDLRIIGATVLKGFAHPNAY
ncbi:undecaprenyl-phosphate glucose phosphotransferase [Burkholderia cepacia]|uniref:Undecaprenyl-phosphate glucose phosphotransferase n=1 Tax=Burkholderia cepacia TaxID=292 RepID=A0A104A061_BURCE|nr:undecaprenyl-phosphate glucose phosphotransferase [Burkholderia cepacia]KVK89305.1 undecaprenyl-phosphate glucose phosphotransferase [Burkholderia cepacia]